MNLRAIVFDFDGTVVESVQTKTEAFRRLFAEYPAHLDRIVALHLAHGGRSRYEKFEMIYREILGRVPDAGEFDDLGHKFEALVADTVVACPFVPGAARFIDEFSARLPLAVVSGTPHDELVGILERRNLRTCFAEVRGSPPGKEIILTEMLQRRGWPAAEVLFVGDAMSDYQAADATGVRFVGRVAAGEVSSFPQGTITIQDLSELHAFAN
jgi:phosphoglycolate phosphatase-like HAD superfamily hydrolase